MLWAIYPVSNPGIPEPNLIYLSQFLKMAETAHTNPQFPEVSAVSKNAEDVETQKVFRSRKEEKAVVKFTLGRQRASNRAS